MYCKNCGKEIKPEEYKCPYCGEETRRSTTSKKLKKILMIAVCCILSIIFIGIIIYKTGIVQHWQKQKKKFLMQKKGYINLDLIH